MKYYIAPLVLLLAGCATSVAPVVSGGSKADGVVVLLGEYGAFRTADIDWSAANREAAATCRGWGYKDAKAFDTYRTACRDNACIGSKAVQLRYQCTG